MARCFLAVWPPPGVVDAITAAPRPALDVRWTRPETYHVTLRFLGEVEPEAVVAALDGVSLPVAAAEVGRDLRRLGRDALVVDVHGIEPLARAVRAATDAVVGRADGPFTGHLTVARRAERVTDRGVLPVRGFLPDGLVFTAATVGLATSRTLPDGAVHTVVATWPTA